MALVDLANAGSGPVGPLCRWDFNFSLGVKWTALISKYIETIPSRENPVGHRY